MGERGPGRAASIIGYISSLLDAMKMKANFKPEMDWTVFTALCRFWQSKQNHLPYQAEMHPIEILLQMRCERFKRILMDVLNLSILKIVNTLIHFLDYHISVRGRG